MQGRSESSPFSMIRKISDFIEKENMIGDGDVIVAGVSGGADSVCLLYVLKEYARTCPFTLIAAHVHHGLRKNADGDEAYVRSLCKEWNIPLHVLHIDAAKEAKEAGISVEEAGRVKRYEFFRQILNEEATDADGRIAVAHHMDDLSETMLFQLFRGSGLSGARGILPVNGQIIRPLLCVERKEIEEFLTERKTEWRTDESNEENTYARNRIRHDILPVAEEINGGAVRHMADAAGHLRQIEDYIKEQAALKAVEILLEIKNPESILIRNEITGLHPVLQGELILEALIRIAGRRRDIGLAQVDAVKELFSSEAGKRRDFIYGITAERSYEGIFLFRKEDGENEVHSASEEVSFDLSGLEKNKEIVIKNLHVRLFDLAAKDETDREDALAEGSETNREGFPGGPEKIPDFGHFPRGLFIKWFDYDVIKGPLCLRTPREGDYLIISSDAHKKKLNDYFTDQKIPRKDREKILILAKDSLVLWVIGYRMGEWGKIGNHTKTVAEIEYRISDML